MPDYRTDGDGLSPRQMQALNALLTAPDATSAAKEIGLSKETLYRYLREPEFLAALREAQAAALDCTSLGLLTLAGKALRTLDAAMDNPTTPISVKVRAADSALTHLLRVKELVDIESRMRVLEEGLTR